MRPLVALLREPSLVRALRGAGYRYVFHDGGYGVLRQPSADRVERPWPYIDELGGRIYARTTAARLLNLVLPRGGLMASRRRHHLRTTLASIRAEEPSAAPALHFVHLVAPHPPFVFNADGSDRPVSDPGGIDDDYEWRHRHRPADETYSAGYVAHSAWLDQALQEPLDRLMAGRPAVIVVQGDHGSRSIHLDLDNPDPDALRERVNILYAIRMHDGRQLELPAQATPVNTLRLVLAEVFGAATPPVDDRTFLQDWHRPYQFR